MVPPELAAPRFAHLAVANLSDNSLQVFPEGMCSYWVDLTALLCSNNALSKLPSDLGSLSRLRTLVLSGNRLRLLPDGLAQLGSLHRLSLDDNFLGPTLSPAGAL